MPPTPSPASPGPGSSVPIPQFDQTLIGLGIYIPLTPSSPSSSSSSITNPAAQLLSPPPFLTPSTQIRRSRSRSRGLVPRTIGTKGGFKASPNERLPRSIYSGDDNPFLPLPGDNQEEELKLGANIFGEKEEGEKRRRNKEYDNIILDLDLDDSELPESTFPQALSTPITHSRFRRNVNMEGMEGIGGRPGPDPYPTTPRPTSSSSDSLAPYTPSTPIPESSPIGVTRTGPSMGLIGSALSEDIAPVPNPLFVASVALSVVLGVLIVGIVSCSVAYCRRNKNWDGDTEKGDGSPKRYTLEGRYKRNKGAKTPDSSRAFGRLFGKKDMGNKEGEEKRTESRPPSILKPPTGYTSPDQTPSSPGESCGKVSFVESPHSPSILVGILQVHRQLYNPPTWQQTPTSPSSIPTTPTSTRPKSTSSSTSRISICAISPLTAIQEECTTQSIHSRSTSIHTTLSRCSSQFLSVDENNRDSMSYNSCSDNSSMTTHASDDAFGYTSRPPSLAESLFGASVDDLTNPRRESTASTASFAPSEEYPNYHLPEEEEEDGSEGDISIDTLSTISIVTPRASPTPDQSLGSPASLAGAISIAGKKSARRRSTGGSPSPALRTRFAIADESESSDEDEEVDDDEEVEEESEGEISAGPRGFMTGSRKIIFLEQAVKALPQAVDVSPSKSETGGVIKRALSVFRSSSPTPNSDMPSTPPRSTSPVFTPLSIITHQSDLDPPTLPSSSSSPTIQTSEDILGIGRFSTASWDQLTSDPTATFDAYYLGGRESIVSTSSASTTSTSTEGRIQREEDEEMWAEINLARISFGLLSSKEDRDDRRASSDYGLMLGNGTGFELDAFPEPASHLPKISVTCH